MATEPYVRGEAPCYSKYGVPYYTLPALPAMPMRLLSPPLGQAG